MTQSSLLVVSASIAVTLAITSGCAQIRTTIPPMERIISVAKESAKEPATWVPIAAAAALTISNTDNDISDWASEETPIFGSQNSAGDFSDDVRNALAAGMVLTSVLAPTPAADNAFPTRRVVTNALAFGTIAGIVATGKRTVQRERPNGSDDKSFPSGHSSGAFSAALLIEKNLNATVQQPWLRKTIKLGTYASASAVAWARVEAEQHHAVDVLFSAGLSNLLVKTFYKSLATDDKTNAPPIAVEATKGGLMITLDHSF